MEDDIPETEKKRRLQVIEDIQETVATRINASLLHTTQQVLVEGRRRGRWFGRNRNDKLVFFDHDDDMKGRMVDVRIEKTGPWSLQGAVPAANRANAYH